MYVSTQNKIRAPTELKEMTRGEIPWRTKNNVWSQVNNIWVGQLVDPSNHNIICVLLVQLKFKNHKLSTYTYL